MSTKRQLLVVDDEPDIGQYIKQLLEGRGYPTLTALSGQIALEIINRRHIDVLVTDIRMPGMDGIELIKQIPPSRKKIQTIVLTGHGDIDTAIEAMKTGTLNYLKKPVNFDELLITIERGLHIIELHEKIKDRTDRLIESNKKLKKALSKIKQLGNLLPICSSCKKIRDDKGYWNQLETYIQCHTDTKFSHGICPECTEKLYGKEFLYDDFLNEG